MVTGTILWKWKHVSGAKRLAGRATGWKQPLASLVVVMLWPLTATTAEPAFRQQSHRLAEELRRSGGVQSQRVLQSIRDTPRHRFVPANVRHQAYFDMALPIGHKQTISSPLIVAQMTEQLDPQPSDVVLEIGTGSGYQAAILSPLVKEVYSVEIVEPLGRRASHTLKELGYTNVFVQIGDGYQGWPDKGPFDKIIVTCSPHDVPQPLIDQLREGGRIIVPVGERYQQVLYRLDKHQGQLQRTALIPTLFVPMTGKADTERPPDADPAKVQLVNGDFERLPSQATGSEPPTDPKNSEPTSAPVDIVPTPSPAATPRQGVPGWYYEQQVECLERDDAPQGRRYASFTNTDAGRSAHLLQGFALHGVHSTHIRVTARIRTQQVEPGASPEMQPAVIVSFYDRDRRELGHRWLGPWKGTLPWTEVADDFPVPAACREAIVRTGLFGATGQFDVDEIAITAGRNSRTP